MLDDGDKQKACWRALKPMAAQTIARACRRKK
jgi:hypothetical protein